MAVSNLSFGAAVDEWVQQTEQRMEAVFKESTQRTVSIAQDIIPRDTGFARASVRASTEEMPPIDDKARGEKGASYSYNSGEITLTIAGAELGQTIYVGWTASYVQFLEYGHSKQAPAGFVGLAAAQWQHTVDVVTQELKGRAGRSPGPAAQ